MRFELDSTGRFLCDCPDKNVVLTNWSSTRPLQPCDSPRKLGPRLETGEWVGQWVDDGAKLQPVDPVAERLWRDSELTRADKAIWAQEDLGLDSTAWRAYRVQLRDWPQSALFPNPTHRPKPPAGSFV
ncbi:phage tail assembly chaperone [Ectopseudomonas mendocina]|uniref:Phage tail assembly chaperone n=1 Tax=Ectopseudomonas mendocina TaxID=300 RepID=A0ABZ2RL75_ECTME